MARLFVAAWPPDDVLDVIAALPRPAVPDVRWTAREQWHVTLRFLGEVAEPRAVTEALSANRSVAALAAEAEAVVGPEVGHFGGRILHVPVDGLDAVAAWVVAATGSIGRPADHRPFAGHITLARTARGARVNLRALAGTPVAGGWPVREVCVVQSRLSSLGARYEVVDRVALRG